MQPGETNGHDAHDTDRSTHDDSALAATVPSLLTPHPVIRAVTFVGSRATGAATPLSDWDFAVDTDAIDVLAPDLSRLLAPLQPLAQQWDPLGQHRTYMLMLHGAVKIDLIFAAPNVEQPPWAPTPDNLQAIDHHFWDWLIWLAAKDLAGKSDLVAAELGKMHQHLLKPLGVSAPPPSIRAAIAAYLAARDLATRAGAMSVPSTMGNQVLQRLRHAGFDV